MWPLKSRLRPVASVAQPSGGGDRLAGGGRASGYVNGVTLNQNNFQKGLTNTVLVAYNRQQFLWRKYEGQD